jgi:hypothetical protein
MHISVVTVKRLNCRDPGRVVLDGQRTWTVTGDDHLPAGPVEEYLEFLRVAQQSSPNTV